MALFTAIVSPKKRILDGAIGEFLRLAHVWPHVEIWGDQSKISPAELSEGEYTLLVIAYSLTGQAVRQKSGGLEISMRPRDILGAKSLAGSPFESGAIVGPGRISLHMGTLGSPPTYLHTSGESMIASSLPRFDSLDLSPVPARSTAEVSFGAVRCSSESFFPEQLVEVRGLKEAAEMLVELLYNAVKSSVASGCAVLFSGGLDSALLTKIMMDCGLDPLPIAVGLEGSHDLRVARESSRCMGLDLVEASLRTEDVASTLTYLRRSMPLSRPMDMALAVMVYVASQVARSQSRRQVIAGQGADELFGGYMRHLRLMREGGDLQSAVMRDLDALWREGVPRDYISSALAGCMLTLPYLDPMVVAIGLRTPASMKIMGGVRKLILRETAALAGLPPEIAWREKKAAQYGSGLDKCIRRLLACGESA